MAQPCVENRERSDLTWAYHHASALAQVRTTSDHLTCAPIAE
jgi:hypothetical protein